MNYVNHDLICYSTFGVDFKNQKYPGEHPLFGIDWHRIILDEGHNIKDSTTLQARACFAIKAQNRWFVTGTPIQNSMTDLYSTMKFLRITPLDQRNEFRRYIERPFLIDTFRAEITTRIRHLLDALMLRRTKSSNVVKLPKRRIIKKRIEFGQKELETYELLRNSQKISLTQSGLNEKTDIAELMKNYLSIMGSLTRMRQACNHYKLVEDEVERIRKTEAQLAGKGINLAQLKATKGTRNTGNGVNGNLKKELEDIAQTIFNNEPNAECRVCQSKLTENNMSITLCRHVSCYDCLQQISNTSGRCPVCNIQLRPNEVVKMPRITVNQNDNWLFGDSDTEVESDCDSDDDIVGALRKEWSSKLEAIVDLTMRHFESRNNGKLVIVSQFTGFLTLIGRALKQVRKGYRMFLFSGSTTEEKRQQMIHAFQRRNLGSKEIMLLSLGSGCVGLNLTAANSMIITEPNWNPGREAQCQDRIYRIGQTRPVTIFKLYMQGTIERKMLGLQKSKRNVMELACANMDGNVNEEDEESQNAKLRRLQEVRAILDHVFKSAEYNVFSEDEDEVEINELGDKI